MREILFGRNAARECLRARRRHIHQLMLADKIEESAIIKEIISLAGQVKIPVQRIPRKKLDGLGQQHQGVALEVGSYPTVEVEDMLARTEKLDALPFLIALDHIEDPHNLGAILRTAEVVGVHGVLLPKQRSVDVTPAVVRVSAGAVEHMWVAKIPNLVQALKKLKQSDVWVVGVENTPDALLYHQANLTGAMALVVGSEGRGMSRLVRETCDFLIKLPMRGQIESLNASVASSLVLYEVWRARGFEGEIVQ